MAADLIRYEFTDIKTTQLHEQDCCVHLKSQFLYKVKTVHELYHTHCYTVFVRKCFLKNAFDKKKDSFLVIAHNYNLILHALSLCTALT